MAVIAKKFDITILISRYKYDIYVGSYNLWLHEVCLKGILTILLWLAVVVTPVPSFAWASSSPFLPAFLTVVLLRSIIVEMILLIVMFGMR